MYTADSPTINKINAITYDSLPTVVFGKDSSADIESTKKIRDLSGRLTDIMLPEGIIETDGITPIPLDICVGKQFKDFGDISITWPKVQEQTLTAVFTLTQRGDTKGQVLTILTKDERSGVDVSTLASDVYHYTIDYFFVSPGGTPQKTNQSQGDIYLVTPNNVGSKHCVPYFIKQGIIGFAGNTNGLVSVSRLH